MAILVTYLIMVVSVSCAENILELKNIGGPVAVKLFFPARNQTDKKNVELLPSIYEALNTLKYVKPGSRMPVEGRSISRIDTENWKKLTLEHGAAFVDLCINDTTYLEDSLTKPGTSENHKQTAAAAMKYIDATTKIPSSILLGHWMWTGDYNECLDIEEVHNLNTSKSFRAKYFAVSLLNSEGKPLLGTYPVMAGICLPDSCTNKDASLLVKYGIDQVKPFLKNVSIEVGKTFSNSDNGLSSGTKAFLVITGILVLLVVLGTVADYFLAKEAPSEPKHLVANYDEPYDQDDDRTGLLSNELFANNIQEESSRCQLVGGKTLEFCRAFSIYSNGKKLFGTKTADGPLACLNGMRVLSMWWVIQGHSYVFFISAFEDSLDALKLIKRFTFQPIVNGTYSVDSFFFLSGLLVAYLAFKQLKEKGSLNWFYYIVHRYWRLTPLYAFVIFYYAYVFPDTLHGPLVLAGEVMGQSLSEGTDICKKYWWTNLLYINNMYPEYGSIQKTCLGWGWYLANDMQFYLVLGPLVILTLQMNKYAGIIVTALLILACIVTRIVLVVYFGVKDAIQMMPTKHLDNKWAVNGLLYQRPYARWSVYLVGMLVGYLLAQKNNRIRIHRLLAFVGWCISIASGLAVIYGLYYYYHNTTDSLQIPPMTKTATAFYLGLGRTVWGLCLAWVVFGCISGNGSFVNDILSWKIWAPLGRLTYAAYLVHPIVMYTYIENVSTLMHFSDLTMIYLFVASLALSYAIAFLVSMLVEAPMIQLEKLLLIPFGKFLQRHLTPGFQMLRMTLFGICRRRDGAE